MTDEPFSVPNRPMAPLREPRPGKPWWTLTKGPSRLSCELFDNGVNGAGYRLLVNGQRWAQGPQFAAHRRPARLT